MKSLELIYFSIIAWSVLFSFFEKKLTLRLFFHAIQFGGNYWKPLGHCIIGQDMFTGNFNPRNLFLKKKIEEIKFSTNFYIWNIKENFKNGWGGWEDKSNTSNVNIFYSTCALIKIYSKIKGWYLRTRKNKKGLGINGFCEKTKNYIVLCGKNCILNRRSTISTMFHFRDILIVIVKISLFLYISVSLRLSVRVYCFTGFQTR